MKLNLVPGIRNLVYGYNEWHKLIGDINNIGEDGENLTIVTLSYNRTSATIKLMKSIEEIIPHFKGVFLVIDNGSLKKEIKILKEEIKKTSLICELVELGKNYGVAGGRNKAIEHIKTEWFMSLDNDIYFISNPLEKIQKTIAELGCKFLNLPLLDESKTKLFSNGGHLYVEYYNGNIHIGAGSLFEQCLSEVDQEFDSSLSTFLYGGASVINKKVFIECGMFDDNMFIGFEDADFSISLFKNGYKVGNCGIISLVHDHKVTSDTKNIEYEKNRFSSKILIESALYFEKKHEIKVWSDIVETWLNEKHALMNSNDTIKNIIKPKIALIVDTDDWAFSNISRQIMKNLDFKYEFKYVVMDDINNIVKLLLLVKDCDLIHFFWRGHLNWLKGDFTNQYLKQLGCMDPDSYLNKLISEMNISTAVYDHLYLDSDLETTKNILDNAKNYYVSSNKLYETYNNIEDIKKPMMVITDGVDLNKFFPKKLERFDNVENRKIIVGWVGNSKWSSDLEDYKGVETILKPVINDLIEQGYPLEMYFADKTERMIPHNKMNDYYSQIDLYICTSMTEGTPNPVLEAMACGVPIISTDVGIVNDAFLEKQKQFIINERSKKCLKEKIIYLLDNSSLFKELSNENIESISKWVWQEKSKDFDEYFEKCLFDINKESIIGREQI